MPFLIAFIVVVFAFIVWSRTNHGKGVLGELFVRVVIGRTKAGKKYVLNNVMIEQENGRTTQIDHVVIKKKGVFVIETKNRAGYIYGNENDREWTQVLSYGKVKNRFYSPVKQNNSHVYHLSKKVSKRARFYSIIVFLRANIRYVNAPGVCTISGLKRALRGGDDNLSVAQMEAIYNEIASENKSHKISTAQHVRNIKKTQRDIEHNICPRCGKKLVLRHGRYSDFMGCQGYPNCKFTKSVN